METTDFKIPDKEHFNTREVADLFGVTLQTVYNWISEGKVQSIKTPGGQLRILRCSLKPELTRTNPN